MAKKHKTSLRQKIDVFAGVEKKERKLDQIGNLSYNWRKKHYEFYFITTLNKKKIEVLDTSVDFVP